MQNSLLVIIKHPPISSERNRDSLDIALACSAFDLPISLLFMGDGILQLRQHNTLNELGVKDISPQIKALSMYDIERIYVRKKDAIRYHIDTDSLALTVEVLDENSAQELLQQADHVINL